MIDHEPVNILGGGLTGLLLAVLLSRRGFRTSVYERGADPRIDGKTEGRSINLALAERGRRALDKAALLDRVMQHTTRMPGRQLHLRDGSVEFQPYGQRPEECIYSISRLDLNVVLMNAAESQGVEIRFNQRCIDIDRRRRILVFEDTTDGHRYETSLRPLLAADGAGSIVRRQLNEQAGFGMTEELLDHGYKELSIPPTAYGAFRMNPYALHVWPRGGYMLIALPNPGGDFTVTLFLAAAGEPGFDSISDRSGAIAFFESNFPDALALMPDFAREFADNPVGIMGTVRCKRWHDGGDTLLIGDAAHAIVPFHGQGMNAAFEDCYTLDELLDADHSSWETLFAEFEQRQKDNANAIADMALENYVEMRDTVRDPAFHLRKYLAFELERRLPNRFVPRYSMVMFHPEVSYRTAFERGRIQAELLAEFTAGCDDANAIDMAGAIDATLDRLSEIELRR